MITPIPGELFHRDEGAVDSGRRHAGGNENVRRVYYFCLGPTEGAPRRSGFSSEIGRPARFGDRKSGKSTARHALHVTIRSAPRSHPIKHTHRKYRFFKWLNMPRGAISAAVCPSQSFRQPDSQLRKS